MYTLRTVLVVLLITELCTCQSTSVTHEAAPFLIVTPSPSCTACDFALATRNASSQSASGMTTIPLAKTSTSTTGIDILFTAYSVPSQYSSNGECITTSGSSIPLAPPYTVTSPATIPSSISNFYSYAAQEIIDYLGFSMCDGGGENVTATALSQICNTTAAFSTPAPSASLPVGTNSTISPTSFTGNLTKPISTPQLGKPAKIDIGVAVPSAALILLSLTAVVWRKRKLRSATIAAEEQQDAKIELHERVTSKGDNQPYLQQKLEARQRIHELDGEAGIQEISAGTYDHQLAVVRTKQELRGVEHSQELDT